LLLAHETFAQADQVPVRVQLVPQLFPPPLAVLAGAGKFEAPDG